MTAHTPRSAPAGHVFTRAATALPASFNEADNSVEVIWTTGALVRRSDWQIGEFDEALSTEPGAVRLDRLNAGAPVLRVHDRFSLEGIIGSIVPGTARMINGQGVARIRLSDTPDAADVVAKVKAGHIRNVSVGYRVFTYLPQETAVGALPQMLATDWEPFEVSLVAIPADPGSQIRSENFMNTPPDTSNLEALPAAGRGVTAATIRRRAAECGLSDRTAADLMERHDEQPFTPEALTAELGTRFAARDTGARQHSGITIQRDEVETTSTRVSEAIYARLSGRAPAPEAREFMGRSMVGLARTMLEARGENVRWLGDAQIAERAMHTTSDFRNLLTGAGNRYLLDSFATAESAIKRVSRMRTAADFRTMTVMKLGGSPLLEVVGEAGEVHRGTMTEGAETYRLATFAKIFSISRQAIINDDMGAFSDPLRLMARGAAETEASQLSALLLRNSGAGPTLADGAALFHTSHANISGTPAVISGTALSEARQAMRDQKDLDGITPLNVVAKTLLVGSKYETLAEQYVAMLQPNNPSDVNPFAGKLEVAVDPRLTGNSWRLFADPAQWPVVEYAYLDGAQGPQLTTREGWDVLGMEFKVVLDFGCGVVDHRGAFYNAGA